MSSLIFYIQEDMAFIAMDTLAVTAEGNPYLFTNKFTYLPTLNTVICGLGLGGFGSEWAENVNRNMRVADIEHLNYFSEEELRKLYAEYCQRYNLSGTESSTIYHIGYSQEEAKMVAFAFRSLNNFKCERLPYGTAVKPECEILEGNLIENIPTMMQMQRDIQKNQPEDSRIYIGGEVRAIHLEKDKATYYNLGEFNDYQENKRYIFG
ncbi:hypothetical protein [Providencia stuartii]|uniref:hypothetical protein n=1 Tax=Providencia stuartii TaxID=588 RepID=UPI00069EE4C1|nr:MULTISPECIES: hypothetical protein [Providencia]KNZ82758.1 hypothetical protein AFL46_19380 [Providencia stuartii]MDT7051917.1 hypothetical protein [Providencia stuartii]GHC04529.1 hypothetical protein GCM10007290_36510 [Providencia thailandensis]